MAIKVVFITSTGAYTVPSDFGSLVSVEVIGAGSGGNPAPSGTGGEGGGGGAYSKSTAITGITASGTVYTSTGAGGASGTAGGDTWFNAASNAAPTLTTQGALAKGGAKGASGTGGAGGAAASGVGTTTTSGGNGGASVSGAFGGGGGAAGPSGAGANGGAGNSVNGGGGGGGGSNGGSAGAAGSTTGGTGGNGVGGTGGGANGNNANGTAGTAGTGGGGGGAVGGTFIGGNSATSAIYTQTSNSATAGPGGGGGGTWYFGTTGGAGGLYGGGGGGAVTGGAGGGGIIVLTYNTPPTSFLVSRLTSTGNLLVNGSFDENTSIAPAKFRTNINTVYAGTFDEVSLATGSVSLTGGQYLSVPNSTQFGLGTGDFTAEGWVYITTTKTNQPMVDFRTLVSDVKLNIFLRDPGGTLSVYSGNTSLIASALNLTQNTWYHIAVTRASGSMKLFVNGTQYGSTYTSAQDFGSTSDMVIGAAGDARGTALYSINGYISNIRIVKGTALYTAAFTPPRSILPAVTGTSLLLNVTNSAYFIADSSPNAFTVTNNGTGTWNTLGPFNLGSTTLKQRLLVDGTLQISGTFDEVTGIS